MILASFIGIFAIPPLYVAFQAAREKLRPSARPKAPSKSPEHEAAQPPAPEAAE